MNVCEDNCGILLEGVEDAVRMVHVDVNVSDPLKVMLRLQRFDGYATVIQCAKPGRGVAAGMMSTSNWHERRPALSSHQGLTSGNGGAYYSRCCLVDARKDRRVPKV